MKYIAHRGSNMYGHKENTLENLTSALEDDRFCGIELDVRESKDHEFVVIHDSFLNRVTDDVGFVKNKKGSYLHKLGLPYLEEILELDTDKIILIEIKDTSMDMKRFVELLNQYPTKNIYVYSFYNNAIHKVLEYPITFKVGVLNYVFNSEHSYKEYDFIGLLKGSITENLLLFFKDLKIEVFVYGIISKDKIKDVSSNLLEEIYYIVDEV